jgi:glyoxylase-like metal-dependent hydrolase (beta-lactamase superfamily II)
MSRAKPKVQPQAPANTALTYPRESPPEPGQPLEIAPGLLWVRVPLPFVLNHVNCWLLDDGPSWTLIDTGADRAETRALWEDVIANHLRGKPIGRLVVTHGHPDHVGLAGWLCEKLNIRLHITLAEWLAPQVWRAQGLEPMREAEKRQFRRNGISERALAKMLESREATPYRNHPLPMSIMRLRDQQEVSLGRRSWRVLVNGGHADEHASFHDSAGKVLIAGDQILSKISPVIGVFTSQPWSDPLADYLASLKRLATLPADTLVLPSHGLPFHALHARIRQLEAHHEERLAALLMHMDGLQTGVDLAKKLFTEAVAKGQLFMAMSETLAHANHLVTRGLAERIETDEAVRFRRLD